MAGAALIVVLLVASGEGDDPSIKAAAKTTHDAIEGDPIVVVREVEPEGLNDVEATRLATALNATAVALVMWRDSQHHTVIVKVRSSRREWVDRSLTFADNDPPAERGRTIGFAVASIVRAPDPMPPDAPPPNPPPPLPIKPIEEPPPSEAKNKTTITVDVLGSGAVGAGSSGVGGDLSSRLWLFNQHAAARLGVGARFGDVSDAGASAIVARFALGAAFRFFPWVRQARSSPFDVGARVDAVALWHQLSRMDTASHGSFLTPGMMGVIEGAWSFAPSFAIVLDAGAEVAFGSIRVLVDNRAATTIEPVRGVAELGLRWEP